MIPRPSLFFEFLTLFLLSDQAGDGAGDAPDQVPIFVKVDLPVLILIQVADQFVGRLPVLGVLEGRKWRKAGQADEEN